MLFIVIAFICIFYAYLFFQNNQDTKKIEPKEIVSSLDRSINWLMANDKQALKENNVILWWMVKRSAEITNDHRLLQVYSKYKKKYVDTHLLGAWQPLFQPGLTVNADPDGLLHLSDYNLYFVYGLTCDANLGQLDVIQRQKTSNYCPDTHPISPACVTHQLMGLRFRQDKNCGDKSAMAFQVKQLQAMIIKQLTWDPRVIDVYLQRVLMLADTGALQQVKHQWVKNILDSQSSAGGWGDFQSLLALSDTRHIGFYSRGIKLGAPKDTLHATVQGILLMSLLSQFSVK